MAIVMAIVMVIIMVIIIVIIMVLKEQKKNFIILLIQFIFNFITNSISFKQRVMEQVFYYYLYQELNFYLLTVIFKQGLQDLIQVGIYYLSEYQSFQDLV